jgi:hypothetical protein
MTRRTQVQCGPTRVGPTYLIVEVAGRRGKLIARSTSGISSILSVHAFFPAPYKGAP